MKKIASETLIAAGLEPEAAEAMAGRVNALSGPAAEAWSRITGEVLTPEHPFKVHEALYHAVFSGWAPKDGPPPAWSPAPGSSAETNIGKLMAELGKGTYQEFFQWSVDDRAAFWDTLVRKLDIRFKQPFSSVMDLSAGVEQPAWLVGAQLNIADSCFTAPSDAPAIVYQPEGGELTTWTTADLLSLTNRVSNGLAAAGFVPGDALACYMPMTAESVAIYLGIVRAGCVAVSIADSFAPEEIAKRLRLSNAKGIFTQDVMLRGGKRLPLYEKVLAAGDTRAIVLPGGESLDVELRDGDLAWDAFLVDNDQFESAGRAPDDGTNILFSSGTTGDPKAIPWTQTTPIKCAADGYLHHDIRPGDVVAWPTNLGWMMGPWLIYASLVNHATIALYYGAPTGRPFARFVQDARVTMLGVVPSLVKAWRAGDCTAGLDWSAIRAFSSTGECSNVDDMLFLMSRAGYKPIIEYCGGTEIGGGYITGTVVQPASPATFSTPGLGLDFVLLDEGGQAAHSGEVFLIPPSIGLSNTLLNREHHEVYYQDCPPGPGGKVLRRHGDQIERLGAGYYRAHGRVDDTMNLGGIKVSSAEIERTLNGVPGVKETAAIGVSGKGGGPEQLVIYVVLAAGAEADTGALAAALQAEIRSHLNPLFKIHDVVIVGALPRTASNKVMHRKLRTDYSAEHGG